MFFTMAAAANDYDDDVFTAAVSVWIASEVTEVFRQRSLQAGCQVSAHHHLAFSDTDLNSVCVLW